MVFGFNLTVQPISNLWKDIIHICYWHHLYASFRLIDQIIGVLAPSYIRSSSDLIISLYNCINHQYLRTHLGWPNCGIGLRSRSVLLLKVSGSIISSTNLGVLI